MPNRSASSSTIVVALATSTPTSMTVVETRTSISPAAKARIVRSFSSGAAGRGADRAAARPAGRPRSSSTTSSAALRRTGRCPGGTLVLVVGLVGLALLELVARDARAHDVDLVTLVDLLAHPAPDPVDPVRAARRGGRRWSGWLRGPAGSSVSVETSRSPKTVIATVRGIGVAVITSTCGGVPALSVSAARCSTPKRCCSSTTTRPRSANCTCSSSSAWVPITMPASPLAARSIASVRGALVIEPVSSSTVVASASPPSMPPAARSPSIAVIERWCCWASTSVGASSAAWPPESTTRSIARSATRVLPEPTSPWSSRFIGWGRARSSSISAADLLLPAGERERQPLVEGGEQAASRRRGPGRRAAPAPPGVGPAPAG